MLLRAGMLVPQTLLRIKYVGVTVSAVEKLTQFNLA